MTNLELRQLILDAIRNSGSFHAGETVKMECLATTIANAIEPELIKDKFGLIERACDILKEECNAK